jgi:cellulose synthase/poly-beta-1,6-N-acetylglucosamine synthase-like glycosyltransferase
VGAIDQVEGIAANSVPFVSIIIPCRNDGTFIAECLDSVIAARYPRDRLEVLVIDGMSEDGTHDIIKHRLKGYGFVRLLSNPRRITPAALNLGIFQSKGDIIVRIDAHSRISPSYITQCVAALEKYQVDNVGGNMVTLPGGTGVISRAIALSLKHWFGVGNSFRRNTSYCGEVDTVFGGCYRRETFERVGLFNEDLPRSQDYEFNVRLRRAGGKILLVPEIVAYYFACPSFCKFWRKNFEDGLWAVVPFAKSKVVPVSTRHLIPLAFVLGLILSIVVSIANPTGVWLLATIAGAYLAVTVFVSAGTTLSERDARYFFVMPAVFANRHFAYGLGSLWGVWWLARSWVSSRLRKK